MISAQAEVLSSSMVLRDQESKFKVRPSGWDREGIGGALERFATTTYEIVADDGKVLSTVRYDGKSDSIIIKKNDEKYETVHHWLKPYEFNYKGKLYHIFETITGKIVIRHKSKVVAEGKTGVSSMVFESHDEELEGVIRELAVGYCIKSMVWFMFV